MRRPLACWQRSVASVRRIAEAAEGTVRQNGTLFEELYERSPDAMIVVAETGSIECVNVQAEALFGYSRERMLGQPIEMLVPERFRYRHAAQRVNYMKSPKVRPMGADIPLVGQRADGSEFAADVMLIPIEIEQPLMVLAVVRDITERKREEARLQLLMREVNHRAKNILSVVQAIANQTDAGSLDEFISRFTARIQSLSASHGLLVRSAWKNVPLTELICSQLAHFEDLLRTRIAVDGPDLRITAPAAHVVGLALHELATNACKYGALLTAAGHVDIRWQVDGDLFTMSWTERDGPPVTAPVRQGFGTMVIDTLVKQSLGGEVQLDFAPAGLAWRVACPATNVLESAAEIHERGR
jgi:PAS domain S-box-containing protein